LQDGEFIFVMIKGVLTHHPIHPILSNVQQKMNYLKTFSHFLTLVPVNPLTSYKPPATRLCAPLPQHWHQLELVLLEVGAKIRGVAIGGLQVDDLEELPSGL